MTTVMIMAGGTGGHVFPALAVARVLEEQGCKVVWLGTHKGIESRVVPAAGIPMEWVRVSGLRGKGLLSWLGAPFRLMQALMDSLRAVRRVRPDVVLGLGGFVAGPGGLAARLLGCPLVIHEQNAVAGMTNRLLSHIADVVAQAFPGAFSGSQSARLIGNPVRRDIEQVGLRREVLREPRHLLIFGGSQGAAVLNRIVPKALAEIPADLRPTVMHQSGRGKADDVRQAYAALGIDADVREFLDDMAAAYSWADLAVTRSGALTVAELAATGLPAVLVPFPAAVDDHQTANARYLSERGAALLIPESELEPTRLARTLVELMSKEAAELTGMSAAARSSAQLGTAYELASVCLEQCKGGAR
jgi:UDP-N-acetylglucosamine--N-acetylmuramyl-(pentapeptide) pyrophosphoryl-undecaprenol N-acetylglucosamine transferase